MAKTKKKTTTRKPSGSRSVSRNLRSKKTPFSKSTLIVFMLVFAAIGGFMLWRSFAAEQIIYDYQYIVPHQSVGYTTPTETRSSKRDSKVIQITNVSETTAKATFTKSVPAGNYKACAYVVRQSGTPSGTFKAIDYDGASLGTTGLTLKSDYNGESCVQLNHRVGSDTTHLSFVVTNTVVNSSVRISSIVLTPSSPTSTPSGWTLKWSDEFNGTALDTAHWDYDGEVFNYKYHKIGSDCTSQSDDPPAGGQQLDGVSLARNVSVADGVLRIKAVKEDYRLSSSWNCVNRKAAGQPWYVKDANLTAHWTGGSVRTINGWWFNKGERIETKFRGSIKSGMRPSMWSKSNVDDGELDFPEMFGKPKPPIDPNDFQGATLNAINDYSPFTQYHKRVPIDNNWHIYACEWGSDGTIRFYIDGVLTHTVPSSFVISNTDHKVRANFQIGGIYGQPIDSAATLETQETDWVRVYRRQ